MLPLDFQEQLGGFQDSFPYGSRGVSPSGIQLPRFAAGEVVLRKRLGHAGAVLGAGTRHGHQEFHGHMGRKCATADLLLHAFREQFHQGQPARHPIHAAIKTARQLLQAVAETVLEFGQQPAFLQSAVSFRATQGTIQDQRFRFAQGPKHRFDHVSAELLQSCNALITVDEQIALELVGHRHNDDGCLLPRGSQRGQQLSLPLWVPDPQKFITAVQLVKFQFHSSSSQAGAILQ
jgi:hypothetical protein